MFHPFHPWSPPGPSGLGTASSGDANARLQERMIGWSMELSATSWSNGSLNLAVSKKGSDFFEDGNLFSNWCKKWKLRNGCQTNYRRGLLDVKVGLESNTIHNIIPSLPAKKYWEFLMTHVHGVFVCCRCRYYCCCCCCRRPISISNIINHHHHHHHHHHHQHLPNGNGTTKNR